MGVLDMGKSRKTTKKASRGLSGDFMDDLQKGRLGAILSLVKSDSSLSIEIRNNYINIYYRGGNLLRLEEIKKSYYSPFFDINYCHKGANFLKGLPKSVHSACDIRSWIEKIPFLKSEMDRWFSDKTKTEREFQQVVVWENNNSPVADSTDYFIIDIEYDNKKGARFDLVGVQWESDMIARKLQSEYAPKLCFFEMKYGDGALGGTSGMADHADAWKKYFSYPEKAIKIKNEMLTLLKQKRELGLIGGLKGNPNEVKEFADGVECIFLLANHDPAKSKLQSVLKSLGQVHIPGAEVKFCVSNFMGYGLYKENIFNLPQFCETYARQIYSGNRP